MVWNIHPLLPDLFLHGIRHSALGIPFGLDVVLDLTVQAKSIPEEGTKVPIYDVFSLDHKIVCIS